ncbi:hypothetical protein AEM42_00855 [Betaproteobacteria bacterium UKL13-2]|nr:hypothetical protein AEM42_00855 [Betaproteobacteria bacterium UKL13-2]HCG53157.1 hypothetical protein [Betaproteobacteria bacterium]
MAAILGLLENAMTETVITLVLFAIFGGAVWLFYWVLTRGGNHAASGGNLGGDPNSLGADRVQAITASTER